MGLLDHLGYGGNPFYQAFDKNRGKITNAFAGLAGAGNDPRAAIQGWTRGLQHGQSVDQENEIIAREQALQDQKIAAEQESQNLTRVWIQQNFPEYASLPVAQGFQLAQQAVTARRNGSGTEDPASIREWNTFSAMTPEQQTQYLIMKRANPYLDLGTGYQATNPAQPGTPAGPMIVKDSFTPAYDSAAGGAAGKTDAGVQAEADSLASKMPGLKQVVDELGDLAEKATYTISGQLWDDVVRETGATPGEGALARTKYMSMVDNQVLPLLRDVFGAAFTVQEGESLRATLGAPNKSPAEKKAVLEAFIEQKTRDLQALQSRAGGSVDYKGKYGLE